jgi:hypothetical protein
MGTGVARPGGARRILQIRLVVRLAAVRAARNHRSHFMSRSTTTTRLAGLFAAVALTACGGGGGGGDDGGASPPPPAGGGSGVDANCSAFASGRYRLVNPIATNPAEQITVLDIDTSARTARVNNATTTYTPDGACQYALDESNYRDTLMISPGGAIVLHGQAKDPGRVPQRYVAFGVPDQSHTVSEWSGRWNVAIWRPVAGATVNYVAETGEFTFDSAGQATASLLCNGLAACAASGSLPRMVASASGGFDVTDNGAAAGRAFLYQAATGNVSFVWMASDGRLVTGTPMLALGALPAVGTVTNYREFSFAGNGTVSPLGASDSATVTAIDSGANRFTRQRASDGRLETLRQDQPRDGVRYRAPDGCSGAASPCAEAVQLPLRGLALDLTLSTTTTPGSAFIVVTVPRP